MVNSESGLNSIAKSIRYECVKMSHKSGAPHLGSALSCVDILVALYWGVLRENDIFIFSKGHAAAALYSVLLERGFLEPEHIRDYAQDGALLTEHPNTKIPGVEWATGSLGHGLSVGVGMALASKIKGEDRHVYVLMSDGECQEGSVWEAAMFASAQKLDNITVIVDFNGWQATGRTHDVGLVTSLDERFLSFGWVFINAYGHYICELERYLRNPSKYPRAIIARTIKGKGVSFMENDNNWHYRIPTVEELRQARRELLG